jgi:hypothetical protein
MNRSNPRWILALLMTGAVSLAASGLAQAAGGKSLGKASGVVPATVEHISGSELSRVTLTERAAERIGLETTRVRRSTHGGGLTVVPYASIIYDPHGGTWVYTSPKERTFVRQKVVVDTIEGDDVMLRDGPPPGTLVASTGVAEIYGTEFGVGH